MQPRRVALLIAELAGGVTDGRQPATPARHVGARLGVHPLHLVPKAPGAPGSGRDEHTPHTDPVRTFSLSQKTNIDTSKQNGQKQSP